MNAMLAAGLMTELSYCSADAAGRMLALEAELLELVRAGCEADEIADVLSEVSWSALGLLRPSDVASEDFTAS